MYTTYIAAVGLGLFEQSQRSKDARWIGDYCFFLALRTRGYDDAQEDFSHSKNGTTFLLLQVFQRCTMAMLNAWLN